MKKLKIFSKWITNKYFLKEQTISISGNITRINTVTLNTFYLPSELTKVNKILITELINEFPLSIYILYCHCFAILIKKLNARKKTHFIHLNYGHRNIQKNNSPFRILKSHHQTTINHQAPPKINCSFEAVSVLCCRLWGSQFFCSFLKYQQQKWRWTKFIDSSKWFQEWKHKHFGASY